MNALIVDDTPTNITLATAMLKKLGYIVSHASSGFAALDHVAKATFELILMDFNMPEQNGVDTVLNIRTLEKAMGREAAVIIGTSASNDPQLIGKFSTSGANGYLEKPIRIAKLREVLGDLV